MPEKEKNRGMVAYELVSFGADELVLRKSYDSNRIEYEFFMKAEGEDLLITGDKTVDKEEAYEREVISTFFKYGRLTRLPAQRKKQEIVLREIARRFESGRDYPEPEVNAIIQTVYDDFCTVRREMIACGLMTRHAVKGGFDVYRLV